ncbi:hypothetical protein [Asticcacaulis tiandongensis]|uniref:hypothetical protein n=1 Tax=Asticcacaulis tiandongensis TaxID=2565365 RepID=UPI00112ACE87|nr:hypothetical protein [Asticcacaulis tiandongensis]
MLKHSTIRLIAAIFISPITPGILFLFVSIFGNISEGVWALKLCAMLGYPVIIVIGIPAHLFFVSVNLRNLLIYNIFGVFVSTLISFIIFYKNIINMFSFGDGGMSVIFIFLVSIFIGVLVSTVFWLIVRPDRELPVS